MKVRTIFKTVFITLAIIDAAQGAVILVREGYKVVKNRLRA